MTLDTINYYANIPSFLDLSNCRDARTYKNVMHFKIKGLCRKPRLLNIASKNDNSKMQKYLEDSISYDLGVPSISLMEKRVLSIFN